MSLEKEYKLDESPDAENEQGEETELEKKLDKVPPVWAPNTNPTNPTNPNSSGSI